MTIRTSETTLWVLGAKSLNADRSIDWYQVCPNLADCDILIINLDSLLSLDPQKEVMNFYDVRKYIFHLLMTGEKVVVFISPTSFEGISDNIERIMPIVPIFKTTASCRFSKIDSVDLDNVMAKAFVQYLQTVKDCNYYISFLDPEFLWKSVDPASDWEIEIYEFTDRVRHHDMLLFSKIFNEARQTIGMSFRIVIQDGNLKELFRTGFIHILPPPTEISAEEGIGIIVNHLVGMELKEPPPMWEHKIKVPGLDEIMKKIDTLKIDAKKITERIRNQETKKDRLTKFRRLLWTKGEKVLQEAVKDAFIELGFTEIRQERARNKEDWIFDFQSRRKIGIIEVSGADKRTSLKDLRKCADWVTDYDAKGKDCRGIFVPNQYRREEYPKSKRKREHFEKNEIQFARKHNISILPSYMLFEAVVQKMEENPALNREFIEGRILSADPICKFDL